MQGSGFSLRLQTIPALILHVFYSTYSPTKLYASFAVRVRHPGRDPVQPPTGGTLGFKHLLQMVLCVWAFSLGLLTTDTTGP